jgi:hypothetical protein
MDVRAPTISGENLTFRLRIPGSLSWKLLEDFKVDLLWRISNLVTYWQPTRIIQNLELVGKTGIDTFCSNVSSELGLWLHLKQSELSFDRFNIAATL